MEDPEPVLYRCRECGNAALSLDPMEPTCCGKEMARDREEGEGYVEPESEDMLKTVFGMAETELDICICCMEKGEATAKELAEAMGMDRSGISRHLNHLAEIGVLEKERRILREGGHTYVYSHTPPDEVKRLFREGLLNWSLEALDLVDEVNREKLEALARGGTEGEGGRIYWEG